MNVQKKVTSLVYQPEVTSKEQNWIDRRDFLKYCGLSMAAVTAGCVQTQRLPTVQSVSLPNILFLLADDHAYEAIHAFGSEVETPNLDRLVQKRRDVYPCL